MKGMLKGMRCLVTGGAGFIGSNLAKELEKRGGDVTVLDNLSTGTLKNLEGFRGKVIKGDAARYAPAPGERFDTIFHQAAITDPRFGDDDEMRRQNLEGFRRMTELAKAWKARLIYASTAGVYGNGPVPMREEQEKDILTAYGQSKLMMDEMAKQLQDSMQIVGLRYFNVYGPGEENKGRAASMILHLARQMKEGKRPRIFSPGAQKRDHIDVRDVVCANLLALEAPSGVYNVGTGVATSFNELVTLLNNILGTALEPEYFDMPYDPRTYQHDTQADLSLAERKLKFRPEWPLEKGIRGYLKEMSPEEKG